MAAAVKNVPKPILDLSDVVRRNIGSDSVRIIRSHDNHGSSFYSVALSGEALGNAGATGEMIAAAVRAGNRAGNRELPTRAASMRAVWRAKSAYRDRKRYATRDETRSVPVEVLSRAQQLAGLLGPRGRS
jgi:hypothetical protein